MSVFERVPSFSGVLADLSPVHGEHANVAGFYTNLTDGPAKAFNRCEANHRFRQAVAFINGGKFKVQTETEQQVGSDCARLIANAVIYYNTALLSKVYEQKVAAGDLDAITFIQGMSPVARQHVNMFGSFEFSDGAPDVDLEALAARYADSVFWSNATQPGQLDLFD